MTTKRCIGQVLPDGHLSLPKCLSKDVGKRYEVILIPMEKDDIYQYAAKVARKSKISTLREKDIEKIIHSSRGIS
ncbi:MAG: hypothetical protein QME74_03445 [Candidatus Edwardsbacteria bacterium]|nr:hypothetical protein [Candidatus Edwardsbacteria bacterium]